MEKQHKTGQFSIGLLMERIAVLEGSLAQKDSVIAEKDSIIVEKDLAISKLDADLNAARFQNDQLRRMIFGSKRERFVSNMDINQLRIEFEPKAAEVAEKVKVEREKIRIEYERKKPKKEHLGRMALPSHLPVVETIIEPVEDTTGMVCIGREITEELDYVPQKLHINRTIRPIYITKEDEKGRQKQVVANLTAQFQSASQARPFCR
jgi:transposase